MVVENMKQLVGTHMSNGCIKWEATLCSQKLQSGFNSKNEIPLEDTLFTWQGTDAEKKNLFNQLVTIL